MFERFTNGARKIVVLAQEEARRLKHDYIGTEHVLLGLLQEGHGLAARALADAGVTLDAAREQVLETVGAGQNPPSGHIPLTPRAKKVLELSLREALQLGVDHIGTEHLLLGLIREGDNTGTRVLVRLGGDPDALRAAVIELIRRLPPGATEDDQVPAAGRRATLRGFVQGRETARPAGAGPAAREFTPDPARTPVHAADPVVDRPEPAERLLAVLGRRERNNALIIGPAGAGKSALVRGLSERLAAGRGPAALADAEVLEVDLLALRGGPERVVRRVSAPVVLIEDLDTLLAADGASRLVLALATLADAGAPLVLTGTESALERLERGFPALAARFEVIELPAAGPVLTLEILRVLRPGLLEFHRIVIDDSALAAAVELGATADGPRVLPGAAVDVLDTAAARLSAERREGEETDAVLGAQQVLALQDWGAGGGAGGFGAGAGDGGVVAGGSAWGGADAGGSSAVDEPDGPGGPGASD